MHLEQLVDAIGLRRGPAVVTGPAGCGKTQLCRALVQQVDASTLTAPIFDPVESEEDLLTRILSAFGIVSRVAPPSARPRATKQELVDALVQFLRGLRRINANAVLIVDDAQNLPDTALAQIESLADLEIGRESLLQVVLAGTPELLDRLRSPEGSSLDQGVAIRVALDAPSAEAQSPPWLQRRVSSVAALLVIALASALAVGVTTILYRQLGF